jgi:pyrroloquinoline quinone biosynthesis protein D
VPIRIDQQSHPALARGVRLQTDAKTGEPMLLYPEGALYLSSTAYDVISRCDGHQTPAAIISSLAEEYDVDVDTLRGDVLECLADLNQRKLLVV